MGNYKVTTQQSTKAGFIDYFILLPLQIEQHKVFTIYQGLKLVMGGVFFSSKSSYNLLEHQQYTKQ